MGFIFLTGCKKSTGSNNNNHSQASTLLNVAYGANAKRQMDIYLPAGRSTDSTKLIFLIHGGGWNEGDKADFTASVACLQTLLPGYAIINTNYRLARNGENIFPPRRTISKQQLILCTVKRTNTGFPINGYLWVPVPAGTWQCCKPANTAAR